MISTRGRYALRVMADIAENGGDGYLPLGEIAARQGISEKYLESILAALTKANLLEGQRGKGGGYKLTRAPQEYALGEILRVTEGTLAPVACLREEKVVCARQNACRTLPLWRDFFRTINDFFDGRTLAGLILPKKD